MTLKELRIQKEISQSEAAQFLNVPLRSYKRYESEKKYEANIKYSYLLTKLKDYKKTTKETKLGRKLKIVVAGIGYVGLSTSLVLSKKANVTLIDINSEKVKLINNHCSPINDENFIREVKSSSIKATSDIYTYKNADVVIVATPTDLDNDTKTLDTFSVESVVRTVKEINRKCLIVIRSTVPVGFTEKLIEQYGVNIVFMPEFLRECHAIKDAHNPTRIIFGVKTETKMIDNFKRTVESSVRNNQKVIIMSPKDAEATKLFSNAYLAMRVAFFNELDSFGIKNNLNIKNVISGMGKDPRIGSSYNNPSAMFEGYCLPKDTMEVQTEMDSIQNNNLIVSIINSNEARLCLIADECINRAKKISNKNENEIVIGIFNLETRRFGKTYRSSSSLRLLKELESRKIKVIVFDKDYETSEKDFDTFVKTSDLIFSNRLDKKLKVCSKKLFTRSIF